MACRLHELIPTQIQEFGGKLACRLAQLGLGYGAYVEAKKGLLYGGLGWLEGSKS